MNISREELTSALGERSQIMVYSFGCTSGMGFGADYLGLLRALMLCLQNGIGFRLGRITRPQGFITKSGWTDYFQPFCGEVSAPLIEWLNRARFPYSRKLPFIKPLVRTWLKTLTNPKASYFAFDVPGPVDFGTLGTVDKLSPPIFLPDEDYLSARRDLVRLLWLYNEETAVEVAQIKKEIDLGDSYVSICVRRGDKDTEHAFVGIDKYTSLLNAQGSNSRRIFVATDDISVVKDISKALPEIDFVTLTEPISKGYFHSDFKNLPASERRRRTIRFFAQLEFLRDSAICVGSKTTNVSWLANALRGGEGVKWVD